MTEYKLYALRLNSDSISTAQNTRFARATKDYVLVYSDKAVKGGTEITESNLYRLSKDDVKWLRDCNYVIIFEETKKKEKEIANALGEKIELLEKSLKEEKEKESEDN